jgi:hypothetical protein
VSKQKKVLVVFPVFTHVLPRPFKNFLDIAFVASRMCPDYRFSFQAPERQSLPRLMNTHANITLDQGFEYLIAFDDDCFPPVDVIPRLIKHMEDGHAMVAALGIMRNFPHTTTVGRYFKDGVSITQHEGGDIRTAPFRWRDSLDQEGLIEADFCGVPVVAIHRRVFESVPSPWFGLVSELDGGECTHDVFFSQKIRKYGFKVLVDTTIKCGHLADAAVVTFENRAYVRELLETHGKPVK